MAEVSILRPQASVDKLLLSPDGPQPWPTASWGSVLVLLPLDPTPLQGTLVLGRVKLREKGREARTWVSASVLEEAQEEREIHCDLVHSSLTNKQALIDRFPPSSKSPQACRRCLMHSWGPAHCVPCLKVLSKIQNWWEWRWGEPSSVQRMQCVP